MKMEGFLCLFQGTPVVNYRVLEETAIRNDDYAFIQSPDSGVVPTHFRNITFFSRLQLDVVARSNLLGSTELESSEKVGRRCPESQGRRHNRDQYQQKKGSGGNTPDIKYDQSTDNDNDNPDNIDAYGGGAFGGFHSG